MKTRLGSIEFINSLPVDLGILNGAVPVDAEIFQGSPTVLNEKILKGEVDISAVSALFYAEHQKDLILLPNLSISSESSVESVILFSRYPVEELAGKDIYVTNKGRTTPALLEILCRKRYGFWPSFKAHVSKIEEWPQSWDAMLLIGDEALEWKRRLVGSEWRAIDLAEEWRHWTKLPFVFAVWVARRAFYEKHAEETRRVHEALIRSKMWGASHMSEVMLASEKKTELPAPTLKSYFSKLSFDFGQNLKRGMRTYFNYAAECGMVAPVGDLEEITLVAANASSTQGSSATVEAILKKALDGQRVSVEEGVKLYHEASLFDLGAVANELNLRKNPESAKRATFVVDRNINYTNYCNTFCKFCAFYRTPGDKKEGYLRTTEEIFHKIEELLELGGTQVLLQGGHNPELGIEYYEDITRRVHTKFPQVHVHSFSASEVWHITKVSNLTVREVLLRLKAAGLNSLPGGGAEILVDRVRQAVSPLKTTVAQYFEVHRTAHEVGLRSTSTMVYGLGETVEERMQHFEGYRTLQDKTGGFRAFIPWSFESESTEMQMPRQTGSEYLRMIALSRIMLDNIQHVQAGWVTEGPKLSQLALLYGADDFGGILMEENVVSATGSDHLYTGVTREEAVRLISETGKIATQRNTNYEIVKVHLPAPSLVTA